MTKEEIAIIAREELEKIAKMSYEEFEEAVKNARIVRMQRAADDLKDLKLNQTTKQ
jgi:hypothetical protein